MNKYKLFALLLLPGLAQAVICKSVDSEGVVSYSQVPASECSEPVKLQPYSTFEPLPIPPSTEGAGIDPAASESSFQGYQSIKIIQPEADGVVRSNEGLVPVTIDLQPALQQGNLVALYIDGKAVQGTFDGLAIDLSGIERGTHSIRASVSDASGNVLIESPAVSFTVRQTGLYDSIATTPRPPIAKPLPRPRPGRFSVASFALPVYSAHMIKSALIAFSLLPGLAHAVICKTVDSEGVVAYAEVPANECRSPLKLPEYSRYAPRPIQQRDAAGNAGAKGHEVRFEGYESIEIVKPITGEEVLSNEGSVQLAVSLEPALQPGHRISIFLDDVLVPGGFDGLAIELGGVDSGGHKVRATVMDDRGTRLIDSAAVKFVLLESEQIDEIPGPTTLPAPN